MTFLSRAFQATSRYWHRAAAASSYSNSQLGAAFFARPNTAAGHPLRSPFLGGGIVVLLSRNDRAQALAADAAFFFGRGPKGDCVRLAAAAVAVGAARAADDAVASDSSCSDGASSECVHVEAQKNAPLRILQLIPVNHPCRALSACA
jgi:hypothetical protein